MNEGSVWLHAASGDRYIVINDLLMVKAQTGVHMTGWVPGILYQCSTTKKFYVRSLVDFMHAFVIESGQP